MDSAPERTNGFAMAVVVEGGLAFAALLARVAVFCSASRTIRASRKAIGDGRRPGYCRHAADAARLLVARQFEAPMLRELRDQVDWLVREMFPTASIPQFAMVATLAGVGEELLFRGALQTKLGDWSTPLIGVGLTSLLFGLAHALSKLYFAFAVIVGAFLGWLAYRYHDLVAPMVAHGLYDFLALAYLSRAKSDLGIKPDKLIHDERTDS